MNADRVEYQYQAMTEWYTGGPSGLEQGFTIQHPPPGLDGQPVTIAVRLPDQWIAALDKDLAGATLHGSKASIRYAGLSAKDAGGKALRIWLHIKGHQLQIEMDDSGAQYPVVIDPTIQNAMLSVVGQQGGYDAVAISGNTVVVGDEYEMLREYETGAAYVFEKPVSGWANMTQTAKLTPSDNAFHFGASVAISGDTIVIGAPWTVVDGVAAQGALYVFVKPASGWTDMTETAILYPYHVNFSGNSYAGSTVAIDGNTIVAGVPNVSVSPALGFGEALVYVMPSGGWKNAYETAVLFINSYYYPWYGAGFGASVAVSGNTIVVGAAGCCVQGVLYEGSAYVFVEPPGGWKTTDSYNAELKGTEVGVNDEFGYSVAMYGNTIVVGSPQFYSYGVGAAYVYVEPAAGWTSMTQTAELYPWFTLDGNFGSSLAISGNLVVIGAPNTEESGGRGVAYGFVKPQSGWTSTSNYTFELTMPPGSGDFGQSVSVSGTTSAVGFGGLVNGAAEVFWLVP
jgi:hypothetical protein